ncbi:MAG: hypothetical protein A2Y89_03230 [Chloroflexi bacterium RBG_13_51_18]|nr:MAG: hypothetical protein A2Y89_03230 [Chloroflexi bacterium RBG_13_51_18]
MKDLRKLVFVGLLAVAALGLLGTTAMAQVTLAALQGTVTDEENAPLPGAEINLKNIESGYSYSALTRPDGTFRISGIDPGKYEVDVSLSGFTTAIRKGVTFNVGANITLDFKLKQASVLEEVLVEAEAPIIEVTKSEISSVTGRKEIDELPLLDRSFTQLALLNAGVTGASAQTYGWDSLRAGAQPQGSSEVRVDGVSNEFAYYNVQRSDLPADAIQEFRTLVNQFSAEYGHASAIVVSAITRSGTNQFRGRIYEFYRGEAFDSKNYFARDIEKEKYSQHRFGGFFGGPIVKDKLHFFISYEGTRKDSYAVISSPLVSSESIPVNEDNNQVMLKLNYQLNEKNMLSFRYTLDYPITKNAGVGGFNTRDRAYDDTRKDNVFQANWTLFPTGNTMNEVKTQYSNRFYETIGNDISAGPDTYQVNRPSGNFGKYWGNPMTWPEKRYEIIDHFSIFLGKHSIKLGFDFNYIDSKVTSMWGYPGIFEFDTDEPFDASSAATYPYLFYWNALAPSTEWFRCRSIAGFIQDKWQPVPSLTFNIGLRYSHYYYYQNPNQEQFKTDNKYNWDPRIGFSWDATGDGKTAIRGGIGKYTNGTMGNTVYVSVISQAEYSIRFINNPGYPDPYQPNPFFPGGELTFPAELLTFTQGPTPYSIQYTLGIDRALLPDLSGSVDLVLSKGYHLYWAINYNPMINGVRQDPTIANWYDLQAGGKSNYRGVYFTLRKRYSNGWALEVNYTLSKGEANVEAGDTNYATNELDRSVDYGPVDNDARHRVNIFGSVDLPLGFTLSGIIAYRSALPYSIYTGNDDNNDNSWIDYAPDYPFRNAARVNSDSYFTFDARLAKFIDIDRFRIQLFVEMFNLTNAVNFTVPVGNMTSSLFQEPTEAGFPRLVQLGVRFEF